MKRIILQTIRPYSSKKEVLYGTVKKYGYHLGISTRHESWPKAIQKTSNFHMDLFSVMMQGYNSQQKERIKISSIYSQSEEEDSIIVFPLGVKVLLKDLKLKEFVDKLVFNNINTIKEFQRVFKDLEYQTLSSKNQLLVCTHNEVDCRCGTIGTKVYKKGVQLNKSEFCTFKVSHIGGHKYAGNVIHYPKGDWYGFINETNFDELIHNISNGIVDWETWRGRYNLSKEEQISLYNSNSNNLE
ncbi:hypothetical protein K502DRAFT_54748 [Neoconidiobolus thromboides FSU 785]|nr:hypothetical protein K502DRAFT_54748 [Neoconidiobolus thromboides FSU 785]